MKIYIYKDVIPFLREDLASDLALLRSALIWPLCGLQIAIDVTGAVKRNIYITVLLYLKYVCYIESG